MGTSFHGYRPLRFGNLNLLYNHGVVRRICHGNTQVLNSIYGAVRNQNWETIPFNIRDEIIEEEINGLRITLVQEYSKGIVNFLARINIFITENKLVYDFDGKARSAFLRNRIGICLLHPIGECKGKAIQIIHSDEKVSSGVFPYKISPEQPFIDITGMHWQPQNHLDANLTFKGEIFEMEDQRNWTDASYKTYGTPLSIPFPVKVEPGTRIRQSVTLCLNGLEHSWVHRDSVKTVITLERGTSSPLPEIGIMQRNDGRELTPAMTGALRKVGFKHYRVDLWPGARGWEEVYEKADREQQLLEWPLEMVLHFGQEPEAELDSFLKKFATLPIPLKRLHIYNKDYLSDKRLLLKVVPKIRKFIPGIPVGGGCDAYFAELNRNPPNTSQLDFISFSICPQVHAFDNLTLLENLEAQTDAARDAIELFGLPVSIGSISLKQRFNVVASNTDEKPVGMDADERQNSAFTAGWTLGSLKNLTLAGASAITLFETAGPGGILDQVGESVTPFPIYYLLQELLKGTEVRIHPTESSDPLEVDGVLLSNGKTEKLLLVNHSNLKKSIRIAGLKHKIHSAWILKDHGWIELPVRNPYEKEFIIESQTLYKILFQQTSDHSSASLAGN